MKLMHSIIKEFTNKRTPTSKNCLKTKESSITMAKGQILDMWSEYAKQIYYDVSEETFDVTYNIELPLAA